MLKITVAGARDLLKTLLNTLADGDDSDSVEKIYRIGCMEAAGMVAAVRQYVEHHKVHHDREVPVGEAMHWLFTRSTGPEARLITAQLTGLVGAVLEAVISGRLPAEKFLGDVRAELTQFEGLPDFDCDDTAGHRVTVTLPDGRVTEARIAAPGAVPTPTGPVNPDPPTFEPVKFVAPGPRDNKVDTSATYTELGSDR